MLRRKARVESRFRDGNDKWFKIIDDLVTTSRFRLSEFILILDVGRGKCAFNICECDKIYFQLSAVYKNQLYLIELEIAFA